MSLTTYLTSDNWTSYITISGLGGITGSGTATKIAKFTATGTIASSTMAENSAGTQLTFAPNVATTGSIIPFLFTASANTGQTASTNTPNFKITGASKQFSTGALATQYFNYFSSNSLAFVGASTATDVYNAFFEITTAGTNATITNNYALGTNGNVKFDDGTSKFIWRAVPTVPSYSGIFLNVNPNSSNYAMANDGSGNTFVNGTANVYVSANATNVSRWGALFQLHTPTAASSGSIVKWQLTIPADTGMTASTNIPNWKILGNTKQFSTGALATQYFNYITANTLAFVGASTATDVYSLFVEKSIAGTNATITNNYAIGTDGNIKAAAYIKTSGTASQFLKADGSSDSTSYSYLIGSDSSDATLTGSTSSTQVKSISVPAGTLSANSIIRLLGGFDKSGTAGTLTVRIYANTVNNLTGTPILMMLSSFVATNLTGELDRPVFVRSSSTWSYTGSVANNMLALSTSTVVSSDLVIDWTVQQYIILALQLGSAADSVNFKSFAVSKY